MTQPRHHFGDAERLGPIRNRRAVDHDNGQVQGPRRLDLGISAGAAGILGHDQINSVFLHQRTIIRRRERPARHEDMVIWKRRRAVWWIDQPQKVEMLRIRGEVLQMHPPDRQHDTGRRAIKGGHSACNIGHARPVVAVLFGPARACERKQRNAGFGTGGNCIAAHPNRKGMGRIDHMGHAISCQIVAQARHPAKAADTLRQGLASGTLHTTCKTDRSRQARLGHCRAKRGGFGCAPENQEFRCHV